MPQEVSAVMSEQLWCWFLASTQPDLKKQGFDEKQILFARDRYTWLRCQLLRRKTNLNTRFMGEQLWVNSMPERIAAVEWVGTRPTSKTSVTVDVIVRVCVM